ncbi:MAG TPA: NHL repeat-containing protein [Candidatus Angelobacter sp.]|jgi:sugar lactone lactonase YvrE
MKTKILRNIFPSLGAVLATALAPITAHAQNLYVTVLSPGEILEYTPSGVQSTFATGLEAPRGLAFDSIGNLFAAEAEFPDHIEIGRVLKFNLSNHVSTFGTVGRGFFFLEGLATDIAGNAYVLATDQHTDTFPGTIFKFTPSGERIVFGSVPGVPNSQSANFGLAFDSAGNLYATATWPQTIYKFAPNGTRTVFVGPSAFATGAYPLGLAFDSAGNLFVSTGFNAGNDTILKFTPSGVESTCATGLTNPRGLAFDSSGNLFVAESNPAPDGGILKFSTCGGMPTAFATGLNRPQLLTFGPPR